MENYADVILPLPLNKYFTYHIPFEMEGSLQSGSRVVVPFGRSKYYTAIVVFLHNNTPGEYEVKDILSVLDERPMLQRPQLKFWEWISSYYFCSVGEVYKAAVPSGLKLESETLVSVNPDYEENEDIRLKERETLVLHALGKREKMSVQELEKESGLRNLLPIIRQLIERDAVFLTEQMKTAYRPKTDVYVRLSFAQSEKERLKALFAQLSGSPKQMKLLMAYLDLSGFMQKGELQEVSRKELIDRSEISLSVLQALVARGGMEMYKKEITRIHSSAAVKEAFSLSINQQKAYGAILDSFKEKDVTLLHGVTSSGKTEIYIHLINDVIGQGRQVLYLVPEIALTTQLTGRLQRVFGEKLAIYHSKFSDNERVEIWNNLLANKGVQVILGVRSSIFLPFRDLGLVIVDEEHETTYKQHDPAPRYHARNGAIVLASMHGAKTLLGTATPSIETYFNAQQGKYGLVELFTRHEDIELPRFLVADTRQLRRRKQMSNNFSPLLLQESRDAIERGEQVILFQNRRGFAPQVECRDCAFVPRCKHCDVSMTYHKRHNQLTCHYCGYTHELPVKCPACGGLHFEHKGFGTERIEDDMDAAFPDVKVVRMDLDTTRTRRSYEQIIEDFEQQKTQVLIGTQMVTKGLDFDHVSVVGILSADSMMNFPDFRAHERAFQMMAQVAGRAGRKNKQGTVVLQTAEPNHPLIAQVMANDYRAMYTIQLNERQQFAYPPFYRLIYIYLKHRDEHLLTQLSQVYATRLKQSFGNRVLGPDNPPVARIQSLHIRKIVLKIETHAAMSKVRDHLYVVYDQMLTDEAFKSLLVYYDVDPM